MKVTKILLVAMLSCMLFAGCKATDIGKEAGALGVFVATYIPIMTKLFLTHQMEIINRQKV